MGWRLMTDKRMVKLNGMEQRKYAASLVWSAPDGYVLTIQEPKRSLDQNAKLWAQLQDISRAEPMGRKHTPDDWKSIMMNACGWECQFAQGLDGRPFPLGFRSSQMTVSQMADLITFNEAFMSEHNIASSEPNPYT